MIWLCLNAIVGDCQVTGDRESLLVKGTVGAMQPASELPKACQ